MRAFAAAHGGDGPGFYTVGFGCDGQPFNIDALRSGSPGAVTTYDLEGYTSSTGDQRLREHRARRRAGHPAGSLQDELGRPVPHGLLVLEARGPDAAAFTPVKGVAASVDGAPNVSASVSVTPSTRTAYRWRFAGTWSVDGSVSPSFTVDVGTVVTAERQPGDDPGGPVAVVGTTRPAKPGVRATLWRVGPAGGRTAVATTPAAEDGGYRFEVARTRRAASYVVTVPATGGNLAGESAPVPVDGRSSARAGRSWPTYRPDRRGRGRRQPGHPPRLRLVPAARHPRVAAPGIAFPLVWTPLYGLVAWGTGRLVDSAQGRERQRLLALVVADLVANAAWNWAFFARRSPAGGLVVITALDGLNLALLREAARRDSRAAAALAPYVAWCGFATALNASIWRRNR